MAERDDGQGLFDTLNIGPLDEFAASTKTMFDALLKQDFSERQAIQFCAEWAVRLADKGGSE